MLATEVQWTLGFILIKTVPGLHPAGVAKLTQLEVAKLTQHHVVTSEVQRLICTGSLHMCSTACAQLHAAENGI